MAKRPRQPKKWFETWKKTLIGGAVVAVVILVAQDEILGAYHTVRAWVVSQIWPTPPEAETISFNAVGGCFAGDLSRIAKVYMPKGVILENGADNLTICDPQKLEALETDMPKALVSKIPGCLSYDDKDHGSLSLIRNSPAVCQIPGSSKMVCDADHAREFFPQASVSYKGDVAPCPDDLLKKFGFAS